MDENIKKSIWFTIILMIVGFLVITVIYVSENKNTIVNILGDKERITNVDLTRHVVNDTYYINERTVYGFTANDLYLTIGENLGKNQVINITSIYPNFPELQSITYSDVLMNQSYQSPIYGYANISIGKYSKTNTTTELKSYWNETVLDFMNKSVVVNHYYWSNDTEMFCEWVLADKSCMFSKYQQTGTETKWDYLPLSNATKSKFVLNGISVSYGQNQIPLPKNSIIQLKMTYTHPIAYGLGSPNVEMNKYNISIANQDGDKGLLDPAWYNTSSNYCKNVNVTGGSAALTDFPFALNVSATANMNDSFNGLHFVNSTCGNDGTEMAHETLVTSINGSAVVWVKGNLSSGLNQFSMYYGTHDNTDNRAEVWKDYSVVYHYETNTSGNFVDSKGNMNSTQTGSVPLINGVFGQAIQQVNAPVAGPASTNRTTQASSNNFQSFGTGDFTVMLWAKVPSGGKLVLANDADTGWASGGAWDLYTFTGNQIKISGDGVDIGTTSYVFNTDEWKHVVWSRTGTTTRVFVNGTNIQNFSDSKNYNSNERMITGQGGSGNTIGSNSQMDEIKIIKGIALSPIAIARDQQNINTSLYSFGPEQTQGSGDTDYPTFSNTLVPANTVYQFKNYYFNTTITKTNGTAGIELNGTNYTLSNVTTLFNKTFVNLTAGNYSYYFWAYGNGSSTNFNRTTTAYLLITPDQVILNRTLQQPADLTTTNANNSLLIQFNITATSPSALLNRSTVQLYWLTNGTGHTDFTWYTNGTITQHGFRTAGVSIANSSSIWNFTVDDSIYPATYLLNFTTFANTVHLSTALDNDNTLIKALVLNMTNTTAYNFLEFMVRNMTSTVASLRVYYCNSTYTTGDVSTSTNCALVGDITNTQVDGHVENQSIHTSIGLPINITTGTVSGIKITDTGYFVWRGRTGGWNASYVPQIARTSATQTSINTGTTWSDLSGTLDYHLHQFSIDDTFRYYVCANDTLGTANCSITFSDSLNNTDLPPSVPIVYNPTAGTYNDTITINYTQSISPNGYAIAFYNISLYNQDDSFNQTIRANNSLNLSYRWNSTAAGIVSGTFNIHVYATDINGKSAFGESADFVISNSANTTTSVSTAPASPITYGTASTFDCTNTGGLVTNLFIDGVNKTSEKGVSIVRKAGTYSLNCTSWDDPVTGKFGSSQVVSYVINKATSALTVTFDTPTEVVFGTTTTATGNNCASETTCTLTENGVAKANPYAAANNVGTYLYNYSTAGNENYTATSGSNQLTVQKALPSLTLTIAPGNTVTTGTSTTTTCSASAGTPMLLRDGTPVANPETTTLALGTYSYNCSVSASANYNGTSTVQSLQVVPVSTGGVSGNVTFNSTSLNTTLTFLVPYHFVTQAYMNLSAINITNNITSENDSVGFTQNAHSTGNSYRGVRILVNRNITLNNISLFNLDTSPNCLLTDDSNNIIVNVTTSNEKAIFEQNLTAGTAYRVVCGGDSEMYYNNGLWTTSLNFTNINMTDQIFAGSINNGDIRSIASIVTSSGSIVGNATSNVNVSVDGMQIFYNSGQFLGTNVKTSNFYSQINRYLANCVFSGGYCSVPITFGSATPGILQYSDVIFNNTGFIENNQSYSLTTFETKNEQFSINISYDTTRYSAASAVLHYNGTDYATNSVLELDNNVVFGTSFDIPLITGTIQNKSFYWIINLYDGTTNYLSNSTIKNQSVSQISLAKCTSGNISLNYTSYDEQDLTRINPFTFDSTFDYYIGTGNVYKTVNYTSTSANEVDFCINPNATYYLNGVIAYSKTTTYNTRNHFYQNYTINNVMQNIPLYLLKATASTSFILQVQSKDILPVPNVLINAQKCYVGLSDNRTVFIHRTNQNGLTTGNFEAETALYQFFITNNSNVLLAVTPCQAIVPQTTPYTLLFQIGTEYISPFINIDNATDIVESMSYNATSRVLMVTYSDTSGEFIGTSLIAKSLNFSGDNQALACNEVNNVSTGIITCNVTEGGTYSASAYIYRNGQIIFDQIVFDVRTFAQTVGYYGVLLGFFITLVGLFAFKWNEIAGIWLIVVVSWFNNIVGLIHYGYVFLTALTCLAIVITGVLER